MPIKEDTRFFYPLALMSGEGLGTAYEYLAKWKKLSPLFLQNDIKNMLIAGLPEKYGLALDFILLGTVNNLSIRIVDDRPAKIGALKRSITPMTEIYKIAPTLDISITKDLVQLDGLEGRYDVILSCEVIQRFDEKDRKLYLTSALNRTNRLFVFAPNAYNPSHAKLTGLATTGEELLSSFLSDVEGVSLVSKGYMDMPPFPPGLNLSQKRRQKAANGRIERFGMAIVDLWRKLESVWPDFVRRRFSHIFWFEIRKN